MLKKVLAVVLVLTLAVSVFCVVSAEQSLAEPLYRFNFGNDGSPTKTGWTPVLLSGTGNNSTTGYDYNPGEGRTYGLVFNGLSLACRNRGNLSGTTTNEFIPGTNTPVYAGLFYDPMASSWIGGSGWGFNTDLPEGNYDVVVFCTDMNGVGNTPSKAAKNTIRVTVEGQPQETMYVVTHRLSKNADNMALPYHVVYSNVAVTDGTLNLLFDSPETPASMNSYDPLLDVTMAWTLTGQQGYVNGVAIYRAGQAPSLAEMLDDPAAVPAPAANYDALSAAFASASEIELTPYEPASTVALTAVLKRASTVLSMKVAPQSAVDQLVRDINAAIAQLQFTTTFSIRQEVYRVNEMITVDVMTGMNVEKVYLRNEAGTGLVGGRDFVVENGRKHWILTTSLATPGDRSLDIIADGKKAGSVDFRLTNRLLAITAPETVEAGKSFTLSVSADPSIGDLVVCDEADQPLTVQKTKNGNQFTLTLALDTAGEERTLVIKGMKDGEIADAVPVTIAVTSNQDLLEAYSALPLYKVNDTITICAVTKPEVNQITLRNEAGAGLVSEKSFVIEDGKKLWTVTTALGTMGPRTLDVFTDSGAKASVSFSLVKSILSASAPKSVNITDSFVISATVDPKVANVALFDAAGEVIPAQIERKSPNLFTMTLSFAKENADLKLTVKALDENGNVLADAGLSMVVVDPMSLPQDGFTVTYKDGIVQIYGVDTSMANSQVALAVYKPGYTGGIDGWYDGLGNAAYVSQLSVGKDGIVSTSFPIKNAEPGIYTVLIGGIYVATAYFSVA